MGDGEQTQLAPSETDTQSARAWGMDELGEIHPRGFDELNETLYESAPPTTRLTAGRITTAAVVASLAAVAVAALVSWQHLRQDEQASTVSPSMVPATVLPTMTTTVTPVAAPVPPPPVPPQVTITTVIKQIPPSVIQVPAPNWTAAHDRQFTATLLAYGWNVWDPVGLTGQARDVCTALRQGATPQSIIGELSGPGSPTTRTEAEVFVRTATETYPGCS